MFEDIDILTVCNVEKKIGIMGGFRNFHYEYLSRSVNVVGERIKYSCSTSDKAEASVLENLFIKQGIRIKTIIIR